MEVGCGLHWRHYECGSIYGGRLFTGLVEDIGAVVSVRPLGAGKSLRVRTAIPLSEVSLGDSIAVNGACLTVERSERGCFWVVAARETMSRTTLRGVRPGTKVHLERAMRLGAHLGGHLVQGHIDGIGTVARVLLERETFVLWVRVPSPLMRYVAEKGSLCVDGVSLTVNEITTDQARVNVVPHTASSTLLSSLKPGDDVNLEVDILAKYVERLMSGGAGEGITPEKLRRFGY